MSTENDYKAALGWAMKQLTGIRHNFSDSKYHCHYCESTREYRKRDVQHTEGCGWAFANRLIKEVGNE